MRFIFQRWRHAQGLAKIFLRQAHQPPAAGPATVETLDNQHFLAAKGCHLSLCHWETKGFGNAQTQPFVFTTFAQVDIVLFYSADRQLKDMTGWGATLGPLPSRLVPQQRRLFLRAGQRNAKVGILLGHPQRCHLIPVEQRGNLIVIQRFGHDIRYRGDLLSRRIELNGAHTVTPDTGQQIKGMSGFNLESGLHAGNNRLRVRQQITEEIKDLRASDPAVL